MQKLIFVLTWVWTWEIFIEKKETYFIAWKLHLITLVELDLQDEVIQLHRNQNILESEACRIVKKKEYLLQLISLRQTMHRTLIDVNYLESLLTEDFARVVKIPLSVSFHLLSLITWTLHIFLTMFDTSRKFGHHCSWTQTRVHKSVSKHSFILGID